MIWIIFIGLIIILVVVVVVVVVIVTDHNNQFNALNTDRHIGRDFNNDILFIMMIDNLQYFFSLSRACVSFTLFQRDINV